MISMPGRARRLESTISICLLAILFLIGLVVFVKQSSVDMSRFGMEAAVAPKSEIPFDLGSLTPAGFETLSKTEIYDSENLYEKINGRAGLYTDSGFKKLFTQRFVNKNDENLWMELFVYDMGNVKNAFSVYSTQRRPDARALPDTQFAYKTSNALFLARANYYVEVVGFSESAQLLSAMAELVEKILTELAPYSPIIPELDLFPRENLIPGSTKLYLTDTFGFDGLTGTFAARYKIDDEVITAFLGRHQDSGNARKIAESYCDFLIQNGGSDKPTSNETLKAFDAKVVDFVGTVEIVFAAGPFVAGVHEADNQHAAEKLAVVLMNKLSEVVKAMSND
jgi:hypothetical protein